MQSSNLFNFKDYFESLLNSLRNFTTSDVCQLSLSSDYKSVKKTSFLFFVDFRHLTISGLSIVTYFLFFLSPIYQSHRSTSVHSYGALSRSHCTEFRRSSTGPILCLYDKYISLLLFSFTLFSRRLCEISPCIDDRSTV